MKELGRSDWESLPEEEAIYWEESAGDSGPEESDISVYGENAELILPVDVLKGASRAIATNAEWRCHEPGRRKGLKPELVCQDGEQGR